MAEKLQKVNRMITDDATSFLQRYQNIVLGTRRICYLIKYEFITLFITPIPGALGLALRKWLYPRLLQACGKGVIFG